MKTVQAAILLCSLLAVADMQSLLVSGASLTYRFDNNSKMFLIKDEGPQCTSPGDIICDGCDKSLKCIAIGGNDYLQTPLETCLTGYTCQARKGCTLGYSTECPAPQQKGEFPCSTIGMYPDPYDCKKYHFCPPDEINPKKPVEFSIIASCDAGYGYNALGTFCSEDLDNDKCPDSDINCSSIGQNAGLSLGSSYFYICKKRFDNDELYPHVYRCPHGEIYAEGGCAKGEDTDNLPVVMPEQPVPGSVESGQIESVPQVPLQPELNPESTGESGKSFVCVSKGNFANPKGCRKFFQCQKADGVPVVQECRIGKHFDAPSGKCVRGTC